MRPSPLTQVDQELALLDLGEFQHALDHVHRGRHEDHVETRAALLRGRPVASINVIGKRAGEVAQGRQQPEPGSWQSTPFVLWD